MRSKAIQRSSNKHSIVKGSIANAALEKDIPLAHALFEADAAAYTDVSGSMQSGVDGTYSFSKAHRTRLDQAEIDLEKLQGEFPGKLAVYAWSSGEEPKWCPDGIPHRHGTGGTEMRKALEHMKKYDDTDMKLYLLSDGYPEDKIDDSDGLYSGYRSRDETEKYVLDYAKTFKSPIHTIFIGPETDSEAKDFMRRLAEVTGGRYVATDKVAELYDPTKKYMLMDGIKPEEDQEESNDDPITL